MDIEALGRSPVGQLVPISGTDALHGAYDYFAFLPNHLPAVPDLRHTAWNAVSATDNALGALRQAIDQLPNPGLLVRPAIVREAVTTSALEGTFAPLVEVLGSRLDLREPQSPEVSEIRAYEKIALEAIAVVEEGYPITIGLLARMQGILAAEATTPVRDPGIVRQHQVFIGPRDRPIEEARFVPPPGDDRLRAGLDEWERWIRVDHSLPVPLQAAMAHYQFETLHPFGDGNGRIGRLVIMLQLLQSGSVPKAAMTISPWLLRHRTQYQHGLLELSRTGDWTGWVEFFCAGLEAQARAHVRVAQDLLDWRRAVHTDLRDRHWTGTIASVTDGLLEWPVVTHRSVAEELNVSIPTAKSAIDRLVEIGVLEEITGRRYDMLFGATRVIALVESL